MNKTIISGVTILCTVAFFLLSCDNQGNKATVSNASETDSIKDAIHSSISWAKNKNFSLLYNVIAKDSNYLEVDPGTKIIRGFDQFRKKRNRLGRLRF